MAHPLLDAAAALRAALMEVEPGAFTPADCATVAEALATTEKACAAGRLLFAARAVAGGVHRHQGVADAATWVARQTGTTPHDAADALRTAGALGDHPETTAALLAGAVSLGQAAEITKTATEVPGAETALLAVARSADLSTVRDHARAARQAELDPEVLHARRHGARSFRHWRDGLGMIRFAGALPPETGIPLVTRIERLAARLRREARHDGQDPEPFEARAADALLAVVRGQGPAPGRTDLVIVCDLGAFRREHAHEGEPCHIMGGGPAPARLARAMADDAFIKAVVHDGVAIHTVAHLGRHLPAELKTALSLGPPPSFRGARCTDCARSYGLELDHVDPLAHGGKTAYANLVHRCVPCHQAKTERDRKAGLLRRGPP